MLITSLQLVLNISKVGLWTLIICYDVVIQIMTQNDFDELFEIVKDHEI